MIKKILILCITFLLSFGAYAQNITASTSATDVYANQAFDVTFSIDGGGGEFTPPDFSPFRIVAGPFQSSNITIVNGQRSESKSFTYRLEIDKPGSYTIGSAQLKTNSFTKKSKSISINVLKASKENAMQGNNIFLEMELNDSTIYVGQQLLIDHNLYYGNIEVKGSSLVGDFPKDRFLVNRVIDGTRIQKKQLMKNGKMQNEAFISRLSIFPLRSGPMTVPDINFQIDLQNPNAPRSRGFFSFNSYDRKVVSTPEFELDVKPLPPDVPEHFTGCVGSLGGRASVTNRNPKVGEEIFVILEFEGNGIAEQVTAPQWKQDQFEIYDAKLVKDEKKIINGEIVFQKQFQYLVIPLEEGSASLKIPYAYFDPTEERYISTFTGIPNIQIRASDQSLSDATSKTLNAVNETATKPWYTQLWIWGIALVLIAGILGIFFNKKSKDKEDSITPEEAALLVAKRQLSSAKNLLDQKETGKYWETLENALRIYLEDKLSIGTSQYSISEISDQWKEKQYDENRLSEWKEMVNKINLARYAGQNIQNMENLYQEALDWIVRCES